MKQKNFHAGIKPLDCLFVHTGHRGDSRWGLSIMPAGLLVLAQYLNRNSVNSGIISLPQVLPGETRIEELVRKLRVKLVCLPMHWHQQSGDVLAWSKRFKKTFPGIPVVLGGLTASFFAQDILQRFQQVDFVIRGDGEVPLLKLVRRLTGGNPYYADIPNLAWREAGAVVMNEMGYTAGLRMFSSLALTDLRFILNKNSRPYSGLCFEGGMFTYVCGRGCLHNCSFCGGGKTAQQRLNARGVPVVKSARDVVKDFGRLARQGIKDILLPLNPFHDEKFYHAIFKQLRATRLGIVLKLDFCGLPSGDLLYDFSRSLDPRSRITAFVSSGSETVRRKNKGQRYGNSELLRVLERAKQLGVQLWPTFTTGLPFETKKDFLATVALLERLKRLKLNDFGTYTFAIEPASPCYLDPAAYGIKLRRRTLEDFMDQGGMYDLGYATEHFTEREIVRNMLRLKRIAQQ